jgi:hypothetical protein
MATQNNFEGLFKGTSLHFQLCLGAAVLLGVGAIVYPRLFGPHDFRYLTQQLELSKTELKSTETRLAEVSRSAEQARITSDAKVRAVKAELDVARTQLAVLAEAAKQVAELERQILAVKATAVASEANYSEGARIAAEKLVASDSQLRITKAELSDVRVRLSSSVAAGERASDLERQLSSINAKWTKAAAEYAEKQRVSDLELSELNNTLIDNRRKLAAIVDNNSRLESQVRNLTADQAAAQAKKLNDIRVVQPEKQASATSVAPSGVVDNKAVWWPFGNPNSPPPSIDQRLQWALGRNRCHRPEIDGPWPKGRDIALKRWSEETGRKIDSLSDSSFLFEVERNGEISCCFDGQETRKLTGGCSKKRSR